MNWTEIAHLALLGAGWETARYAVRVLVDVVTVDQ